MGISRVEWCIIGFVVEAVLRMHAPWASRSLLPEAAQTRAEKLRLITFFFFFFFTQQCMSSIVTVVCVLRERRSSSPCAASAAAAAQIWHNYLSQESTTTSPPPSTPWVFTCIILVFQKVFHYDRGVHYPGVSPAGSNSAWARGACYPRTAAHAAESNTTGAQGGGGMPSRLSPPVAARAQLNVSDDMTRARKNAHCSSGGSEWHGHAAGMVSGLCNSCAMRQLLRMNISCCNRLLRKKKKKTEHPPQSVYLFGELNT